MTTALLIALALLLVAALLGQIRINRRAELDRRPRPQLPAPDPRQAMEYDLPWVFADARVINHPLYPDPIRLGTYQAVLDAGRKSRAETEADARYAEIYGGEHYRADRTLRQVYDHWRRGE